MNTIEFNIGQLIEKSGKIWTVGQVRSFVTEMFHAPKIFKSIAGSYKGVTQRTCYALCYTDSKLSDSIIFRGVETLCIQLEQESIAIVLNGIGYLIYHPRFKHTKMNFDEQYFVRP